MKKSGYDVRLSAGAITAGGTLGILIPPSVMLIVMGPVVGVPTTDLFAAAVIPGLVLARSTSSTAWGAATSTPRLAPSLPMEDRLGSTAAIVKELVLGVVPVVVVILATLGVILAGIATPTDAGACGAFVVFLMTLVSGTLTWEKLQEVASTRRSKCRA